MKITSRTLAGIVVLAALVVVFDYAMKYSGLKIPFPPLPFLKFDFTGIPIILSLLLFGLVPSAFSSAIAFLAILARSGDVIGSSMKGLSEFTTVLGMYFGFKLAKKFRFPAAFLLGVLTRVALMTVANFALIYAGLMAIPTSYKEIPLTYFLLTGIVNVIQGCISIFGGYLIYVAIDKRIPGLLKSVTVESEGSRCC